MTVGRSRFLVFGMVLGILLPIVCSSINVVHAQTVVLNVYGSVTNGNWVRDWLTDLPDYNSTISYSVSNSGNLDAKNVSISISIDGNPYFTYIVPLIAMYSTYSSSFLYSTPYNQTKSVLIVASCQSSSNFCTLTVGSTFPTYFDTGNISPTAEFYITPNEQSVTAMKKYILSIKSPLDPDWTALWSWVGSHITYSQGSYYHWKFPWDTLQSGEGMCVDYSTLLVSLYRDGVFGPNDAYVVVGTIPLGNGTVGYHAWVIVRLPVFGWYSLDPQENGGFLLNPLLNPFVVSGYTGLFEFNDQQFKTIGTTVYINSDGSVVPSSAPIVSVDNVTYTFTGNMNFPTYNGIVVERSNIVIDGKGYMMQGNYNTNGLNLTGINNAMVKNIHFEKFQNGIYLFDSNNNIISGNTATANNGDGISLWLSSNNTVIGNTATANVRVGIYLGGGSSYNIVSGNNVTANSLSGIDLYYSSNNIISGNNVTANSLNGIYLESSSNNTVIGNTATANNGDGISLWLSSNNTVIGNNARANVRVGIYLGGSSYNIVSGNNVTANSLSGIDLYYSSYNTIYHNNLVGNAAQASVDSASISDTWDNGYPSGGNYWSDYNGTDANHDGIGDTPCVIDTNNVDRYPFMGPYSTSPLSVSISPSSSILDVGQSITFTSSVFGGVSPYTYQWGVNGIWVSGATSRTWTFTPTSAGLFAIYAEVTDNVGTQAVSYTTTVKVNGPETPDVVVTNYTLSKNVVGLGYNLSISLTVADGGNYMETFNATVFANNTFVGFSTVTDLPSGMSTVLYFSFDTAGFAYGSYSLSVTIESNLASNSYTCGHVTITIPGDFDGNLNVNLFDLYTLAQSYGSKAGDSKWNPNVDIDGNGVVGLYDLYILTQHYGQHYQ